MFLPPTRTVTSHKTCCSRMTLSVSNERAWWFEFLKTEGCSGDPLVLPGEDAIFFRLLFVHFLGGKVCEIKKETL